MRFMHTKCGGEIDVKKRRCLRCKKKWDPISFRLDPVGIRPIVDKYGKPKPNRRERVTEEEKHVSSLPKWMQTFVAAPYLDWFVSKLPKWPRWARITVSAAVVAGIILLIVYLT